VDLFSDLSFPYLMSYKYRGLRYKPIYCNGAGVVPAYLVPTADRVFFDSDD